MASAGFESFHRASNVENRPGSGLGLAIVKKADEVHGGRIEFASTLGAGTRFTVALALRAPGPAPEVCSAPHGGDHSIGPCP